MIWIQGDPGYEDLGPGRPKKLYEDLGSGGAQGARIWALGGPGYKDLDFLGSIPRMCK